MAAAEVRAAWQRSVNRCNVQEDAKRAPNFTCCPSPSMPQNDSVDVNAEDGKDYHATDFMPLNWNPVNPKLSPDTKWWLQQQPCFQCEKDYVSAKLSKVDNESNREVEPTFLPSKLAYESLHFDSVDLEHQGELFPDSSWIVSSAFRKHGSETRFETKSTMKYSQQLLKHNADSGDDLSQDRQQMDLNVVNQLTPKTSDMSSFDMETPWSDSVKSEPWWHLSDEEELVQLLAQKSIELTENCDLPRPTRSMHTSGSPFSYPKHLESMRMFPGRKADTGVDKDDHSQNHFALESLVGNRRSFDGGSTLTNAGKLHRSSRGMAIKHDETSHTDPIRAELLEALRHSQTRARKAEIAAQKAYDEKEHIVKLLFRQASHLFAYKQWVHMLQLETLCLQLRIKEQQLSKVIQSPPWMAFTNRKASKENNHKKKRKKTNCNFCRNAVALAVGLGLAGAGLLLGWTLGWLFTAF